MHFFKLNGAIRTISTVSWCVRTHVANFLVVLIIEKENKCIYITIRVFSTARTEVWVYLLPIHKVASNEGAPCSGRVLAARCNGQERRNTRAYFTTTYNKTRQKLIQKVTHKKVITRHLLQGSWNQM